MPHARACSTQNTASDGRALLVVIGRTSLAPQERSSLARREWTSLANLAVSFALVGELASPDAGGRALLAVSGRGSHAAAVEFCAPRVVEPHSPSVNEPCSPRVAEPCSL
eukprot:3391013-Pleurochrysis_carterae.AAC.1